MLQVALGSALLTVVSGSVYVYAMRVIAKRRKEALAKATVPVRRRR